MILLAITAISWLVHNGKSAFDGSVSLTISRRIGLTIRHVALRQTHPGFALVEPRTMKRMTPTFLPLPPLRQDQSSQTSVAFRAAKTSPVPFIKDHRLILACKIAI